MVLQGELLAAAERGVKSQVEVSDMSL